MNTIYGPDIWNYGAGKLRNCGEGFGGRKAVAALTTGFSRFLRFAAVLLLVVVGVNGVKAQTDYSGTYYIASMANKAETKATTTYYLNNPTNSDNFYLCPTEGWYYYKAVNTVQTDNNEQPFLTTYKCKDGIYDATKAVWVVQKHPTEENCYYIRQRSTGRYIISNGQISGSSNANRVRVHLETVADPNSLDDKALFEITFHNDHLDILPHSVDGRNGDNIYLVVNNGNFNNLKAHSSKPDLPDGTYGKGTGGIIGLYSHEDNEKFYFEDIISAPVITQQDDNTIAITYPGPETVTLYYTTDGSKPDPANADGDNPTKTYSGSAFALADDVTTIKVVAKKAKEEGEALDTYSRVVTFDVIVRLGDSHPYLLQSQENTNYYMIPVTDTNNAGGFIKANTTTLGQPAMMWYFKNAGNVGGVQYYYMVNKSTGQYVYYHNPSNNYLISISEENYDESFAALDDEGKEPYRFSINSAADGGYNICPKSKADRCIIKGTSNQHNGYIASQTSKTAAIGRWEFISVSDQKMPATTPPVMVSTASAVVYYTLENERNTGNYISPETYVTTTNSVTDNDKWYFLQADNDDWLTYYHIVNAVSGKYLYLNNTGSNAVSTKALSEDTNNPDKYQFVLAPSSTGAYYIIPKSQATQRSRQYTSLYSDATDPLQTKNRRYYVANNDPDNVAGDDAFIKWIFAEVDLSTCQNPVFSVSGENIIMSCPTFGAEIHYTNDGTTPTASTETVFTNETSLSVDDQHLIKAIAVLNGVTSSVVTLLNKPNITLSQSTYTYNGGENKPTIDAVSITKTQGTITADASAYSVPTYGNNVTDVGTPTVTVTDADATDTWYIWNASTTFSINKAPLTITPVADQSKVYGENDPTLTYSSSIATSSGLYGTDAFDGVLGRAEGENVGNYAINQGTLKVKRESTDVSENYAITIADESFTITARPITISGITASEKTYDGNTTATLDFTGVTYGNIVEGDELTVTATGTFEDKNAGTGKSVTISDITLGGTDVTNYTLAASEQQETTTADINPKPLTIANVDFTASGKTYDGTTDAVFESIDYSQATIEGVLDGDNLTINSATGTFEDKNVGTNKTVSITGFIFGGTDADNYTYNGGNLTATADINAKSLTITEGVSGVNKEYDGTTTAELDFSSATFDGMIAGDNLTASGTGTFVDKEVGLDKTVTISGLTLIGGDAGNYELAASGHQETTSATISVKVVTIIGITAEDKTYDGTTDATLVTTGATFAEGDIVEGENLTVVTTAATGTFDTKDVVVEDNVIIGKTVTINGLAIGGANVGNYVLSAEAPTTTAKINPAELTEVTITPTALVYNGEGQTVSVTSVKAGTLDVTDADYVVSGNTQTNANTTENPTYTITVSARENTESYTNNFSGSKTATFTINPKSIGNGALASGFTISFDTDNNIILKDGETTLGNTDYTIDDEVTISASGRYSIRTVRGTGNYGGTADIRNAIVTFTNDGNGGSEYSATFVAESADPDAEPDNTKGHALPDGITAYTITAINGNTVTAVPLSYIPEGVPVLLLANTAAGGFRVQDVSGQTLPEGTVSDNLLKEVTTETPGYVDDSEDDNYQKAYFDVKTIYMLYRNEFVFNMDGYLAKGKVYLDPTAYTPAPSRLMINTDSGTSIQSLQSSVELQSDVWYSIDGRRLSGKPTKKGIYIRNGQVVVIK